MWIVDSDIQSTFYGLIIHIGTIELGTSHIHAPYEYITAEKVKRL